MRVLYVLSELDAGGAAVVHRLLADRLTARGAHVDIFSYCPGRGEVIFGSYPQEQIICGPEMTLTELLCRRDYDVVHAVSDTPERGLERSLRLARSHSVVLLTCHGYEFPSCSVRFVDAFIAVSNSVADFLKQRTDTPVRVIYNGVDEHLFQPGSSTRDGRPIVLWVGRPYDERKDYPGLACLATSMVQDDVDFAVVAACSDTYPLTLDEWLPDTVQQHRNLTQPELAAMYRRVAASGGCTVSTSVCEGFGMAIVESMACGCPVVVPRIGGISEVVDDCAGILYDRPTSCFGLRNAVLGVIRNPDLYDSVAAAGLRAVEARFTATAMAENHYATYVELLQNRTVRSASVLDRARRSTVRSLCRARRALG